MRHFNVDNARPLIEAEIDRLIHVLDVLDNDPELEDNADLEPSTGDEEPSIGAPNEPVGSWRGAGVEGDDDREQDNCDDEDSHDREPCCEDEGAQCEGEGDWNHV